SPSFSFTHLSTSAVYTLSLHDALPILNSCSPSAELMLIRIHLAPRISLSFRSGEVSASSMVRCARFSPLQAALPKIATPPFFIRSEEHTSELQSRENLVCRLLLEKKKE